MNYLVLFAEGLAALQAFDRGVFGCSVDLSRVTQHWSLGPSISCWGYVEAYFWCTKLLCFVYYDVFPPFLGLFVEVLHPLKFLEEELLVYACRLT